LNREFSAYNRETYSTNRELEWPAVV